MAGSDNIAIFSGSTGKIVEDSGSSIPDVLSDAATSSQAYTNAAVTGLASVFQPLDSDLTTIAGLSPTNDDILQRKSGAWANRSIAQLIADIVASGSFGFKGVQEFAISGTYTPTSDTKTAFLIGCGAGGGGGGLGTAAAPTDTFVGAGNGGAGELRAMALGISVASYTVTIPTGGAGTFPGNNNGGTPANDLIVNDGSSNIFVARSGTGGSGGAGNVFPGHGVNGSGGTGGIELTTLMISPSQSSITLAFNQTGGWNTLFGTPHQQPFYLTSASNTLGFIKFGNGLNGRGRGGGGQGGWHTSGSTTAAAGGNGFAGYLLVIEMG